MEALEKLEIEMGMMKAQAARKELEFRIAKLKIEIIKLEEHILLQDELIKKAQQALG